MKFKKSFPLLMAGLLAVSGIPVSAGTYSDLEIQSLEKWTESFSDLYQNSMDNYNTVTSGESGTTGNMYLEVTDTVRALLAIASPVDISWLDRVGLSFDTAVLGSLYAITGSAYINETDLLTFEFYLDTATLTAYACVPELSPYYLKLDMSTEMTAADMEYLALYTSDIASFLPDAQTVKNILNRYCTILFSHIQDGNSGNTTYTVGNSELSSAAYEGRMMQEDAYAFVTDILTTAQTDEDLKTIIETWSALDPEYGDSYYSDFQTAVSDAIASMEAEKETMSADDTSYISSSIWTDDEQNIIGRTLSFVEDDEKETLLQYSNLNTETDNSFYLNIDADGTSVTLNGSGTYTDGKLDGSYDLLIDNETFATIAVAEYDTAAMEKSALNGIFKLTLQPGALDDETYTALSSFAVLLDSSMDSETNASNQTLSITSADVPLVSLHVNAEYTDPVAIPDLASLPSVLDIVNSEDDLMTFVSELDWSPMLDNCRSVGIPEELILQIDTLITDALYGTADAYDDDYVEMNESYSDEELIDIEIPEEESIAVIGGADGPTSIFLAGTLDENENMDSDMIVEEVPVEEELITIE